MYDDITLMEREVTAKEVGRGNDQGLWCGYFDDTVHAHYCVRDLECWEGFMVYGPGCVIRRLICQYLGIDNAWGRNLCNVRQSRKPFVLSRFQAQRICVVRSRNIHRGERETLRSFPQTMFCHHLCFRRHSYSFCRSRNSYSEYLHDLLRPWESRIITETTH